MRALAVLVAAATAGLVAAAGPSGSVTVAGPDWNAAYQAAQPGDTISVPAGTYGDQVIGYRAALAGLPCTPADTSKCVTLSIDGPVTVTKLEIHGGDLLIKGNGQLRSSGYIDTEADSATNHPDHVIVQDAAATSFGVFNADTVTFKNLNVGPATVTSGCSYREGNGFENKIGSAGGIVYSPRAIVLDGLRIHDQNGDTGRIASDCHDGGLFLAGAQGLTIKNTVFQGNVVYNVQIQSINGAPISNVTFSNDSFGCPADWLYNGARCDNQSSIQFDGTYPGVAIQNSAFAEGVGAIGWGCYAGTCDYTGDSFAGNTFLAASLTAPPLGTTPPPPPPPTTTGVTTTSPPPDTAGKEIDKATAEFKATTITYPLWASRVKAGYYGTGWATSTAWGRGFADLTKAKTLAP